MASAFTWESFMPDISTGGGLFCKHSSGSGGEKRGSELDEILSESAPLKIPLNLKPAYFELRQEMHDMRDRLEGRVPR